MLKDLGIPIHTYSDYLNNIELSQELNTSVPQPAAQHIKAGSLRYYAVGELDGSDVSADVLKQYETAAEITQRVCYGLAEKENIDVVVAHHGIYVPQGQLVESFRENGVRIVTWGVSYRSKTVIFSHDESYHFTMPKEPFEPVLNWDQKKKKKYLIT